MTRTTSVKVWTKMDMALEKHRGSHHEIKKGGGGGGTGEQW